MMINKIWSNVRPTMNDIHTVIKQKRLAFLVRIKKFDNIQFNTIEQPKYKLKAKQYDYKKDTDDNFV